MENENKSLREKQTQDRNKRQNPVQNGYNEVYAENKKRLNMKQRIHILETKLREKDKDIIVMKRKINSCKDFEDNYLHMKKRLEDNRETLMFLRLQIQEKEITLRQYPQMLSFINCLVVLLENSICSQDNELKATVRS